MYSLKKYFEDYTMGESASAAYFFAHCRIGVCPDTGLEYLVKTCGSGRDEAGYAKL